MSTEKFKVFGKDQRLAFGFLFKWLNSCIQVSSEKLFIDTLNNIDHFNYWPSIIFSLVNFFKSFFYNQNKTLHNDNLFSPSKQAAEVKLHLVW